MARELRVLIDGKGFGNVGTNILLTFMGILAAIFIVTFIILSCAQGMPRDKSAAAESSVYEGAGCAAGCDALMQIEFSI
ncbi:hypothetical protein RND71_029358 [Anisodus tanguticus]|uniref:Uncharacterized protein n=1 Tax=Anisodus tanguticus TaxID=243964 RepID=A0AAE1RDA2_9SOLA|nr:hypothetical protein RND71_029358 [Anisodus tanguticus]